MRIRLLKKRSIAFPINKLFNFKFLLFPIFIVIRDLYEIALSVLNCFG